MTLIALLILLKCWLCGVEFDGKWYKEGDKLPSCICHVGKAQMFIEAEIAAGRWKP